LKGGVDVQVTPYSINTQQIRGSETRKIGNVALPNYSEFHFCTKTAPAMSEDKYKSAIIEQAKKDQAAGVLGAHSAGYRQLCKSYVSCVSPDRNKIINEGLTRIIRDNKPQPETLNLIDYLFGKVKYHKDDKDCSYAEFYDGNGELVAKYSNGGWSFCSTKAEVSRENEFIALYNEAWNSAARASMNGGGAVVANAEENSIDITV